MLPTLMPQSPSFTLIAPYASQIPGGGPAQTACLSKLAGRGSVQRVWDKRDAQSLLQPWQQALLQSLHVDAAGWASGPVSALGAGLRDITGCWMHAEPIHFAAGLDRLTFVALTDEAQVTGAEREALARTLLPQFPADGFTLHAAHDRWFIQAERNLQVQTSSPEAAASGELPSMMPRGADAPRLRRLMTELQMMLHEHPVNERRAARGLPAINALWLWGAGTLVSPQRRELPAAYGAAPFLKGVYQLHEQTVAPLPGDGAMLIGGAPCSSLAIDETSDLEILESRWFAPLISLLAAGRIARLEIVLDEWRVQTHRADLRRFWRRSLPPARWSDAS
ncbi:MAG TPA: hypothetical protein VIT67_17015 [Povalibacter sp.]